MPGTRRFLALCLAISAVVVGMLLVDMLSYEDVPPEVAAGYTLWQAQNCSGCHTLYGQGGAYAPDLTRIYAQRGADDISDLLIDPTAPEIHPFTLNPDERDALVAMLEWVGTQRP